MRYRKLDALGDYTLGTGADFFDNEPNAVAQAVLTRLRLWLKDWFLDETEGTDYQTNVLGPLHQVNPDAIIRNRVLDTPGVTAISNYVSTRDPATRQLQVTMTVDTVYGSVTFSAGGFLP